MWVRVYRAEVDVEASVERVWDALVDLERYPEWNPFTVSARSTLEIDAPIDLEVHMEGRGETLLRREWVRRNEPHRALDWGMTILGGWILRGERTQRLEPLAAERCRYVTVDTISGPLAPLVGALFGSSLERGFEKMAAALADHLVEASPRP